MTGDTPYLPRKDYDYHDFSVEDFASGIARFDNGMQIMLKFSWALNLPRNDGYKIVGDKAGLVYDKSSGAQNPITLYGQRESTCQTKIWKLPSPEKALCTISGMKC